MSMLTEFHLACTLKPDTPESVLDVLRRWLAGEGYPEVTHEGAKWPGDWPDHPFFSTGSGYAIPLKKGYKVEGDMGLFGHVLEVHEWVRNYDDEIAKFLSWVGPYVDETKLPLAAFEYEDHLATRWPTFFIIERDASGQNAWVEIEKLAAKDVHHCSGRALAWEIGTFLRGYLSEADFKVAIGSRMTELEFVDGDRGWVSRRSPMETAALEGRVLKDRPSSAIGSDNQA